MIKPQCTKSFLLSIFLGVMLLCGVQAANASGFSRIVVDIPFDFIVNGKTLAAGRYTLQRVLPNSDYALYIARVGSDEGISFTTNSAVNLAAPNEGELIFHRYGSAYFLSEVWTGSASIGYRLPRSKAERMAERGERKEDSMNGASKTANRDHDVVVGGKSK